MVEYKQVGNEKVKLNTAEIAENKAKLSLHETRLAEEAKVQYKADRINGTYNEDGTVKDIGYPSTGDQLDALWKELNYRRLQGEDLVQDADDMLGAVPAVKQAHPKPE